MNMTIENVVEKNVVATNEHVEKLISDLTKNQLRLKTVGMDMITLAIQSGHMLLDLKAEVKNNIGHQWKSWIEYGYENGTFPISYKQVSKYMKLAANADEVQEIADYKAVKGEFLTIDQMYKMLSASYTELESEQGDVYVFTCEGHPGLIKIGMTTQQNTAVGRATKLSQQTGVVYPWICEKYICVDHAREVEQLVHKMLDDLRLFDNKEFFKASVEFADFTIKKAEQIVSKRKAK